RAVRAAGRHGPAGRQRPGRAARADVLLPAERDPRARREARDLPDDQSRRRARLPDRRDQRQRHGDPRLREPVHHGVRRAGRVPDRVQRVLRARAPLHAGQADRHAGGDVSVIALNGSDVEATGAPPAPVAVGSRWARLALAHFWVAFTAFGVAALMAVMQAMSRANAALPFRSPQIFYLSVTAHGVLMALVFTTFFIMGLGYIIARTTLGRELMSERLGWIGFAVALLGTALTAATILAGEASVLYTFYPPLRAHPLFYIGATLLVVGSWIWCAIMLRGYRAWRRDHPEEPVPVAMHGIIATVIVWLLATVGVAAEMLFLLIPWSLGLKETVDPVQARALFWWFGHPLVYFWLPATVGVAAEMLFLLIPWSLGLAETVDPVLARTLFWWFGHPLVYFWLLPAYALCYAVLPRAVGGKLFSDPLARVVFVLFILFSTPVGFHHQFMDPGIAGEWKLAHTLSTY